MLNFYLGLEIQYGSIDSFSPFWQAGHKNCGLPPGNRYGIVVRALAYQQCGLCFPSLGIMWVEFVVVLILIPRGFSLVIWFYPLFKT